MLKALRRFTQLLRVHIYVPGCCKYIRMANGLQPLADLCMDVSYADVAAFCDTFPNDRLQTTQHSSRLYHRKLAKQIQQS